LDVRAALAVASDFAGGSRGNTGVHLRVGDLVIIAGGEKVMRLRARKGEILHEAVTGREKVLRFPAAQMDGWASLISRDDHAKVPPKLIRFFRQKFGLARSVWTHD
jgi:hypothetical protein